MFQGTSPFVITASTTSNAGGGLTVASQALAVASQVAATADLTLVVPAIDTKRRLIVTVNQIRQLITQKFVQVTTTGETVILAGTSGTYHDLLCLMISAATSNIVGAKCTILDSSGGATQFILNVSAGGSGGGEADIVMDFDPPWKHSTATSTGSAWTATFSIAGTYNIMAQFSDWTS